MTAYNLRISAWSSDVCSSDLSPRPCRRSRPPLPRRARRRCPPDPRPRSPRRSRSFPGSRSSLASGRLPPRCRTGHLCEVERGVHQADVAERLREVTELATGHRVVLLGEEPHVVAQGEQPLEQRSRSEEHTSELQSLMRISYAVFCLKKKKTKYTK